MEVARFLTPKVDPQRIVTLILWPITVMMIIHRSLILGVNGSRTDDFTPVYQAALDFLNRRPVYAENYDTVDPHYLYPPSGSLIMSPFAVIDPERARWLFIFATVVAIILSAYLLTRLFGYRAGSWVFPAVLFFFFCTESVSNTLVFTNANGFVLLGMVAFLMLMRGRYDLWAGAALGLTLAVKPVLAPLLLLPLLNRQWKVLITGIGVPVLLNAVAWPYANDPMDFVRRTAPYLLETRDYYNSSISGMGLYFGLPTWLTVVLRAAFVVMTVFSLWFLYRYYRTRDELLWLTTSSGVLLCATFLVGSLGQGYYSMMLFPLLMTVFRAGSVMRNWPAWLGVYGCLSFDVWASKRWEPLGRYLEYGRVTWGWSLLLIAIFCVLLFRWLDVRGLDDAAADASTDSDGPDTPGPDTAARATVEA